MKRSSRVKGRIGWWGWIGALAVLAAMAAPAHAEKAHGPPPKDIKEPPSPIFETSCPDFNGCFWTQASYSGARFVAGTGYAGAWYGLVGFDRSSKNRFGNRRIQFAEYEGGGTYRIVGCLNAGNNDANLGASIDSFKVGAQGTTC